MLGRIPDNGDSRQAVRIIDIAKIRDELGIVAPGPDATSEDVLEYLTTLYVDSKAELGASINSRAWLSGLNSYADQIHELTYRTLGLDVRNVDQIGIFGDDEGHARELLLGSYSPGVTAERLADCDDCIPHDIVEYSNTEYYAWGEDFRNNLRERLSPPAHDGLGRGGRIYIDEGFVARTLANEYIEQIIDTSAGEQPSLFDDPAYVLAAKILAEHGAITARFTGRVNTVESSLEQMEDVWANGLFKVTTIEEIEEQFSVAHLLLPWEVAVVGTVPPTSEDAPFNTYAVLVHSNEEDAAKNFDRLTQRIEQDTFLFGDIVPNDSFDLNNGKPEAATWGEYFNDYEVSIEGKAVIVWVTAESYGEGLSRALMWQPDHRVHIHYLFVAE